MNKTFEVEIFNEHVAAAVAKGERYKKLDDGWAEMRYVEVTAADEDAARRRLLSRYSADDGFVIRAVRPIDS